MDIRQYDVQLCIDTDPPNEKWYYWTQVWFCDFDNPPPFSESIYYISIAWGGGTLQTVFPVSMRLSWPPYTGENATITALPHERGDLLVPDGKFVMNTGARFNFYSGDKLVGYKRWRVPLRPEDIEGENLSIGIWSQLSGMVTENLLLAQICSWRGEPIDRIEVDRRIHLWQWRHGTKRRARPVIALA